MEWMNADARTLAGLIKEGKISVAETVEYYKMQIEQKDSSVQAFLTVAEDGLEERIKNVQTGIKEGQWV